MRRSSNRIIPTALAFYDKILSILVFQTIYLSISQNITTNLKSHFLQYLKHQVRTVGDDAMRPLFDQPAHIVLTVYGPVVYPDTVDIGRPYDGRRPGQLQVVGKGEHIRPQRHDGVAVGQHR